MLVTTVALALGAPTVSYNNLFGNSNSIVVNGGTGVASPPSAAAPSPSMSPSVLNPCGNTVDTDAATTTYPPSKVLTANKEWFGLDKYSPFHENLWKRWLPGYRLCNGARFYYNTFTTVVWDTLPKIPNPSSVDVESSSMVPAWQAWKTTVDGCKSAATPCSDAEEAAAKLVIKEVELLQWVLKTEEEAPFWNGAGTLYASKLVFGTEIQLPVPQPVVSEYYKNNAALFESTYAPLSSVLNTSVYVDGTPFSMVSKLQFDVHVVALFGAVPNTRYTAEAKAGLQAMNFGGTGDGYSVDVEYSMKGDKIIPLHFDTCLTAEKLYDFMQTITIDGESFACSARGLTLLGSMVELFKYEVGLQADTTMACDKSDAEGGEVWQFGFDAAQAIKYSTKWMVDFVSHPWLDEPAYYEVAFRYLDTFSIHLFNINGFDQCQAQGRNYVVPTLEPNNPWPPLFNAANVTKLSEDKKVFKAVIDSGQYPDFATALAGQGEMLINLASSA